MVSVLGDVEEAKHEESCQQVEHPVLALKAAGEELQSGVAGEAEAEAVGDGVSEWDRHQCEEGGDGDGGLVPFDAPDASKHESANDDERG